MSEAGGGTYFFYNKEGDLNKFQYSVEIPFKYDIDTDTFEYNDMKLFDLCEKLRLVFKENGQEQET
ncbi:immunity protein YezG family protein [Sporolactobacillus putidus]|uniref:immunity protein YezG family protein n=1 Tax=Sporolactobacillus putidus TaxID=492735 RepID=UPI0035715ECA